jgi:hypothetical protein
MAFNPLTNLAETGVANLKRRRGEVGGIAEAVNPTLRGIETASGMVPGANVLQANLRNVDALAPQQTYMESQASSLPNYVNAARAYQKSLEDAAKRRGASTGTGAGDGMGGMGMTGNEQLGFNLPDATDYMTVVNAIIDARRRLETGRQSTYRPSTSRMMSEY